MIAADCHFAGVLPNGHIDSGPLFLHEVDEFVESCVNAGWRSVAVASGTQIVAKWRRT